MQSESIFKDQIVWVTGASSGIGEAMAKDFIARGAKVILTARRKDRLEALAKQLGPNAKILPADLSQLETLPSLAKDALSLFGRIDVLLNNAGLSQRSSVMDTPFEHEKKVIDVDLLCPIILTKAILPHMAARGSGRILVTSSVMGYLELPGSATYSCVKHGINGYFYSLGYEVKSKGILVQVIEPGFVKTEVSISAMTADGKPNGKMDDAHSKAMTAEVFSKRAFKKIEKNKSQILITGWEGLILRLRWHCPELYAFVVHRLAGKVMKDRFKKQV